MHFIPVLYRSFISLGTLFLVAKMIGKKQVSQFSLFDYVISISIGNFAAEMTINIDSPELDGIIAVVIFGFIAYIVSMMTLKSVTLRRFFMGKPTIIIDNGNIIKSNMKKNHLDINNLLEEARIKGFFNLSEIQYGVLEANGEMSFLAFPEYRSVTPNVMNIKTGKELLCGNVIIDGNIIDKNLEELGKDRKWLNKKIDNYKLEDIILATVDSNGNIHIYVDKHIDSKNILE